MSHLSSWLREEGGYEYKKAIVTTLLLIIDSNPEMKETALAHLCELFTQGLVNSKNSNHTVLTYRGPDYNQPVYSGHLYTTDILPVPRMAVINRFHCT